MEIGNYELTADEFYGKTKIKGSLYLDNLTSIPAGFAATVGGRIYLGGLSR